MTATATIKTVYRASNINGRFNHLRGKAAALDYAREVEKDADLSEAELVELGWTFRKCSPAYARSVGLA